jgi:hypothetical protein
VVVYNRTTVVARHQRAIGKGAKVLDLDHYRGKPMATTRAGTVGRPNAERLNKSAKYSSPNSAPPCSANSR